MHPHYDLLLQNSNVHILAEIDYEGESCLLARPGARREDIRKVVAHSSELKNCEDYLREWGVVIDCRPDSGSVVKEIMSQPGNELAAIGSELSAELHGLEVLERNIQGADLKNFTRSLLISAEPCSVTYPEGVLMKTSIVFWLPNENSSLYHVLAAFALREINLTKLESRPVPATYLKKFSGDREGANNGTEKPKMYEYFCYIDVLDSPEDPKEKRKEKLKNALKHLRELTSVVRELGCYPTQGGTEELCRALAAASAQPVAATRAIAGTQLRIAIIGFGNFGQFLAKEFAKKHVVFATSQRDYTPQAQALGVTFVPWNRAEELLTCHHADVILVSTSITSFRSVIEGLPHEALRQWRPLVVDVCSVKAIPKKDMLELLPKECDILCTHPMFGPESGKHGWYGLPFVAELVRASKWERAQKFLSIFEDAKCNMVIMPCEEHDQYAASSQFLTHFTGRSLAKQGCVPTSIDLKSFKSLCKVVETTCKDSFDLFYGLFKYNDSSMATIQALKGAFFDIEKRLRFRKTKSLSSLQGPEPDELLVTSAIVQSIEESKTAVVQALSKQLKDSGVKVNDALCIGEPDYPPPPEVLKALAEAGKEGQTKYTEVQGDLDLRKEICKYLRGKKNVTYAPEQICLSNGGKQCIYQVMLAVCDYGDEVLVPTPCWVSYHDIARLCNAKPVPVATFAEDGYLLHAHMVEEALKASGSKAKVLVLCNPCNPTGAVVPRESLEAIARVLRQPEYSHVYILADEIYEQLVFDTPHTCFAALEGMRERTLLIGGFSKGFAMTGLRLGYLAAEPLITATVVKVQGQLSACPSSISQRAALVALRDVSPAWTAARIKELREKRDFVLSKLSAMLGVACQIPQGAFYAFVDLSGVIDSKDSRCRSGEDFCKVLLQDFKVALVPGEAFHQPKSVRISYACSLQDLASAMGAFGACVAAVQKGAH